MGCITQCYSNSRMTRGRSRRLRSLMVIYILYCIYGVKLFLMPMIMMYYLLVYWHSSVFFSISIVICISLMAFFLITAIILVLSNLWYVLFPLHVEIAVMLLGSFSLLSCVPFFLQLLFCSCVLCMFFDRLRMVCRRFLGLLILFSLLDSLVFAILLAVLNIVFS